MRSTRLRDVVRWVCSVIPTVFDALTGQRSSIWLLIVGWCQGGTPGYFSALLATMAETPRLGLSTGQAGSNISLGRSRPGAAMRISSRLISSARSP